MRVDGTAIIVADGQELQSEPGTVRFDPGLGVGTPRMGPRGYIGSSYKPGMSELECDIIPVEGFDVTALTEGREVTLQVADAQNGSRWVVNRMVVMESPRFEDGENAKWSIKLSGETAERV